MFTGLIEGIGKVVLCSSAGRAARLRLEMGRIAEGVNLGDSVAVNGACLTVTHVDGRIVEFDVSAETLRVTTLADLKPGEEVNLERSLRVGDRLGGHFVLGHVDAVGKILALHKSPGQITLDVVAAADVLAQLIPKGSVAVDGISLTVADLRPDRFSVAIIPTTFRKTTLRSKSSGDRVNIELDVIGKYVAGLLGRSRGAASGPAGEISVEFLAEHGF